MLARHGNESPRAVEPYGFVPQGSKVIEIAAGSATQIKDRIRRVALYRIEECSVILADIVVSRTVPESLCEPIIIRDRRLAEAPELFRLIKSSGAAHRPCRQSRVLCLGSVRSEESDDLVRYVRLFERRNLLGREFHVHARERLG